MSARLTDLLVHRFDAELRRRGRRAFEAGAVLLKESEPGFALAEVHEPGDVVRDVGLRWSGDGLSFTAACTCEPFKRARSCEHLWAVVQAIDAGASSAAEPGSAETRKKPSKRGADETWKRRLGQLHDLVAGARRDAWQDVQSGARRIVYVADPRESDPEGDLCLRVFAQNKLKSGTWGVRRPFDAANALLDQLEDPLDRLVLGALRGADVALTPPDDDAGRELMLNRANRELLLERLCRSGRLFLESTSRAESDALGFDSGAPWSPVFALERDETVREARLAGWLARDGERMELDEPALLFEDGWLCARGVFARFDPRGSLELVLELRREGPVRAPIELHSELQASLLEVPGNAQLADGAPGVIEGVVPRPLLRVGAPRAGGEDELDCWISFDYGGVIVASGDARGLVKHFDEHTYAPGTLPRLTRRDFAAEARRLAEFLACGGSSDRLGEGERDGVVDARTLPILVTDLLARGWNVDAQGKRYRRAGAMKLSVKSGIDWFDLEGGIDFDGQIASMPALLAAAKKGASVVQLGDGSVGLLPEDWLSRWGLLEVSGDAKGERVRFKKSQGWLLDALLLERGDIAVDEGFERWHARLESFRGLDAEPEPKTFRGELRPYQREGLGWFRFLRDLGFGGCLADDMGLGKTVQVLAMLEERRLAGGERKPSLVVAPKSLTFNWRAEAARFTPDLSVLDYTGIERTKLAKKVFDHDLVVTTYGTLRQDAAFFKDVEFDYVILDEAQAIKNPASQIAKAARLLRAEHKLVLSGTPVENHLGELWSLFEFLNPGMLGRSSIFRELFAGKAQLAPDEERRKLLGRALRPFFLRRTKEQVLRDLPEKSEQILWCELDERERQDYDALATHFRASLLAPGGGDELSGETRFHVLEALLRLRQASCHPGLLDKTRAGGESAKLEVLVPLLEEVVESEHKALVFSQFTSFLSIVRTRLDAAKIDYAYLDGQTNDRQAQVERFQNDPQCKLFLVSLKAGGFGLNLTAADYVFLLDPWWNPAAEAQAIDRAHRLGQTRNVMAYRLIARGTVEERVLELQSKKRALAEAILTEDNALLRDLTRDDLARLLS